MDRRDYLKFKAPLRNSCEARTIKGLAAFVLSAFGFPPTIMFHAISVIYIIANQKLSLLFPIYDHELFLN